MAGVGKGVQYKKLKTRSFRGGLDKGDEDPCLLTEEFLCLYDKKIKEIEDSGNSPEMKVKTLEDWICDLVEQNRMLLKTIKELECEALKRVNAFSNLAAAAKDTSTSETCRCPEELLKKCEMERKIQELQCLLQQNEERLADCGDKIDCLTDHLAEKNDECNMLRDNRCRASDFESKICQLEDELAAKSEMIKCLQQEKSKSALDPCSPRCQARVDQVNLLRSEVRQKNCLIDELKRNIFDACELKELESCKLNKLLEQKEELIDKLVGSVAVSGKACMELRVQDCKNTSDFLKNELKHKDQNLKEKTEMVDCLRGKLQEMEACDQERECKVTELMEQNDCLNCLLQKKDCECVELTCKLKEVEADLCETCKDLQEKEKRIVTLEDCVKCMQMELDESKSSSNQEDERVQQLKSEMEAVKSDLCKKEYEIERHKEQEQNLKFQIEEVDCVKNTEQARMMDVISKMNYQLDLKEQEVYTCQKKIKELRNCLALRVNDEDGKSKLREMGAGDAEVTNIKNKLMDVQKALTAEIAEKHDEIRQLKDDVKDLEDKLLQADQQTQFKDDIIKELRKEVKLGRAKESLAEMLGLKGTPMRRRLDLVTCQLEESRVEAAWLQERLSSCDLATVLALRATLTEAESKLAAMSNKMDYVRRYLDNLKNDEELSIKCGVEALLAELQDDLEWNRQTRRNMSLDEGTSVIVISHRSQSLPDNTLRRPARAKSDTAVTSKSPSLMTQDTLNDESPIIKFRTTEKHLDKSTKKVCYLWDSLKMFAKNCGNTAMRELGEIQKVADLERQSLMKLVGHGVEVGSGNHVSIHCYKLEYLETNLKDLMKVLTTNKIISSDDLDFEPLGAAAGVGDGHTLSRTLYNMICDSLSLLHELKTDTSQISDCPETGSRIVHELISSLTTILSEKEMFLEKLKNVQNMQASFLESFFTKLALIDTTLIGQQDLINGLKEDTKEILRSAEDKQCQLMEKEQMIEELKTRSVSQQSDDTWHTPSIKFNERFIEDRGLQLLELLVSVQEDFDTLSDRLSKGWIKVSDWTDETKSLALLIEQLNVQTVGLRKETGDGGEVEELTTTIGVLEEGLHQAKGHVNILVEQIETLLCSQGRDNPLVVSNALQSKMKMIIDVSKFIKNNGDDEDLIITSLQNENKSLKQKISYIEQLLRRVSSSPAGDMEENKSFMEEEYESCDNMMEDASIDKINVLKKTLDTTRSDLNRIQSLYENLKIEKKEMEENNQRVMQELQTKVSNLQAASQSEDASNDTLMKNLIHRHREQLLQFEKSIESLQEQLANKVKEIEMSHREKRALMDRLNFAFKENGALKEKLESANAMLLAAQQDRKELQVECERIRCLFEEMNQMKELKEDELRHLEAEYADSRTELEKMRLSGAANNANVVKQLQELRILKEEKKNMQEEMWILHGNIKDKLEETAHWKATANKQKENLTKLLEENQSLKSHKECEGKEVSRLKSIIENVEKQMHEIQETHCDVTGELVKERQISCQLGYDKMRLESMLRQLEVIIKDKDRQLWDLQNGKVNTAQTQAKIEEQKEVIEIMTLRIAELYKLVEDKEETIKILAGQLRASSEMMAKESDAGDLSLCSSSDDDKLQANLMSLKDRVGALKGKLRHTMVQNWKLLRMVSRLQQLNYLLLRRDPTPLDESQIRRVWANHQSCNMKTEESAGYDSSLSSDWR